MLKWVGLSSQIFCALIRFVDNQQQIVIVAPLCQFHHLLPSHHCDWLAQLSCFHREFGLVAGAECWGTLISEWSEQVLLRQQRLRGPVFRFNLIRIIFQPILVCMMGICYVGTLYHCTYKEWSYLGKILIEEEEHLFICIVLMRPQFSGPSACVFWMLCIIQA